jgi:hypothetical protein
VNREVTTVGLTWRFFPFIALIGMTNIKTLLQSVRITELQPEPVQRAKDQMIVLLTNQIPQHLTQQQAAS